MNVELDELCEWCFESGRERPATSMVAGVPLCQSCASGTKQERFPEKKAALYEPEPAATSPVRAVPIPPKVDKIIVQEPEKPAAKYEVFDRAAKKLEPETRGEIDRTAVRRENNKKLVESEWKFCACGCGGLIDKDARQKYLPSHTPAPKPVPKTNMCGCGCGAAIAATAKFARGHHWAAKQLAEPEPVSKDAITTEFEIKRRVVVLVPGAKPTTQIRITDEIARAIWKSLTLEQKCQIIDIEDMWETWDDWLRMTMMSKVLLIHDEKL